MIKTNISLKIHLIAMYTMYRTGLYEKKINIFITDEANSHYFYFVVKFFYNGFIENIKKSDSMQNLSLFYALSRKMLNGHG